MEPQAKMIPNDEIMLRDLHHVSLLVRDVEKSAENFAKVFGIGPFSVTQYNAPATKATVYGKSCGYRLKFGNAKIGSITLELVQTVDGNSALTDHLEKHGEGLHHLAYNCPPPIDDELAKWKKRGIDALQVDKSISDDPRYGWAYMDTEKLVGCVIEILCLPP
jgi:4-hydroxyphenylpyruvate dioxygenase-like putative hemolysin